jgi:hypothetical protein
MTDQLEALFADLRAETIPEVRPPGTSAVRRTVRRRRQTRTTVIAGTAVLVLTGGAVWSVHPGAGIHTPATALGRPDAVSVARDAVNENVGSIAVVGGSDWLNGTAFGQASAAPGEYSIFVACATAGAVNLMQVSIGTGDPARTLKAQWVPCDRSPKPTRIEFRAPRLTVLQVSLTADTPDGSKVGYAYRVVADVLDAVPEASATSTANALHALEKVRAAGGSGSAQAYTSEVDLALWAGKFHRGTVFLRLTCAGPGTVQMQARRMGLDAGLTDPVTGPVLAKRTLRCTAAGATAKVPLTLPAEGSVGLELQPDGKARNKAGYATTIDLD